MAATSAGCLSSPARTPAVCASSRRSPTAATLLSLLRWGSDRGRPDLPGAAARTVTTVRTEAAGPLLGRLPAEGALSWVRRGEGLVGWGEAARLEVSGPHALAEAAAWWAEYTDGLDVDDDLGVPGSGPVLFASIAFDPTAGTSVFVVPEVVRRPARRRRLGDDRSGTSTRATFSRPSRPTTGPRPAPLRRRRPRPGHLVRRRRHRGRADRRRRARQGGARPRPAGLRRRPARPRRLLRRLADRFPDCWTFAVDGLLGATPSCCCAAAAGSCRPACWPAPPRGARAPTTTGWPRR